MKTLRCACGWEITGPEDEVIKAVIEHGQKLHNMRATPEEVRARLESVQAPSTGT